MGTTPAIEEEDAQSGPERDRKGIKIASNLLEAREHITFVGFEHFQQQNEFRFCPFLK